MRKKIFIVVCFLVVLGSILIFNMFQENSNDNEKLNNDNNKSDKDKEMIVVDNANYDVLSFLKMEQGDKNLIYSPLSIKYAFNMLRDGTRGESKNQLDEFLGSSTLNKYDNIDKRLSIANGVFIKDDFKDNINKSYVNDLESKYNASVYYDSFKNGDKINKWVSEKTFKIIDKIINEVYPDTILILVNALAIDMEWNNDFSFSDTYGGDFNGKISTIMSRIAYEENTSYYIDDSITVLNMDLAKYENTQLSFSAIMPNSELSTFIDNFKIEDYSELLNKSKEASKNEYGVKIYVPKFSFGYEIDLKNDMISLGVKDIFDVNKADLRFISEIPLYVSNAKHKATIQFSEEGIKAAAVTSVDVSWSSAPISDVEVRIDKPFMFIIRDKNTNEIWFVGTVYEVNKWEDDKENYK